MTAQELLAAKKMYDELDAHFRQKHHDEIVHSFDAEMKKPAFREAYKNDKENAAFMHGVTDGGQEVRGALDRALDTFYKGDR